MSGGPRVGDSFSVHCENTRGVLVTADVFAEEVDRVTVPAAWRIRTTRPGAASSERAYPSRMEFFVDDDGVEVGAR